jgi:hypothetical protein
MTGDEPKSANDDNVSLNRLLSALPLPLPSPMPDCLVVVVV